MAQIKWSKKNKYLTAFGRKLKCSCIVRNEVNGWRKSDQVVRSIPKELPFQPRQFPNGEWVVGTPVMRDDTYKAPWFIPTNAEQFLPVWEVRKGKYIKPTNEKTLDKGYGLHFSTSNTTLGCIKINRKKDLLFLVEQINKAHFKGETVKIEVTD